MILYESLAVSIKIIHHVFSDCSIETNSRLTCVDAVSIMTAMEADAGTEHSLMRDMLPTYLDIVCVYVCIYIYICV